ncbi:LysR substrate-binding domain-containing protein [Paracoccus sp. MBLB3053]|uniref:LysR substrate-binding domain-containing protein n=1 Tax=Paracoccus aurantius TaxID=3073814 RepID=A0ABU2HXP8_9RHOB|nr:LysR substrate-binding domain-containing protein [Paracoccus sp. MBLB3053]MDS9469325.1 LysR substrate-binding domain-containing protein [Paracoccus sp. MBLB3053]
MNMPPLSALEALDALDRTGSVGEAARACALSQSAVSHKLRALEARLGFALTEPRGRGVVLTSQGRRYLAAVRPGLEALREAHRGIGQARGNLEVGCASGLAATWLARRLQGFLNRFPEVALSLRSLPLGEPQPGCDIALAFTDTALPGAVHLLDVRFFPVCFPGLMHRAGIPDPSDLRPEMLLHLQNRGDWADWLRLAGADGKAAQGGVRFTGLLAMYAAAEAGLGLCLGDGLTCADALTTGRLMRPYPHEINVASAYWAVPGAGGLTAPAEAFLIWLQAEMAASLPSPDGDPPP